MGADVILYIIYDHIALFGHHLTMASFFILIVGHACVNELEIGHSMTF